MVNPILVGIDMGTTGYSAVMYTPEKGAVPLLDFDDLDRTPCYVAHFVEGFNKRIGLNAKQIENDNPESFVVYEPKRLFGCKFSDENVQALIPFLRYSVQNDDNINDLTIVIEGKNTIFRTTPYNNYISILKNIKRTIRQSIKNASVIQVVIAVPSTFTMEQRDKTISTAESAGFKVIALLHESSAIARSCFSKMRNLKKGDYFMVYDLGASDFKISIFKVTDGDFSIAFTSNHTGLSGQSFDFLILDYICQKVKKIHNFDAKLDKDMMRQILIKSEEARINLSEATNSTIVLENVPPTCKTTLEISRAKFEEIAKYLIEQTVRVVDQFINNTKANRRLIQHIVLHGGLSRTPKIRQLLIEHFGDIILEELVFEDANVAEGAALLATRIFSFDLQRNVIKMSNKNKSILPEDT